MILLFEALNHNNRIKGLHKIFPTVIQHHHQANFYRFGSESYLKATLKWEVQPLLLKLSFALQKNNFDEQAYDDFKLSTNEMIP